MSLLFLVAIKQSLNKINRHSCTQHLKSYLNVSISLLSLESIASECQAHACAPHGNSPLADAQADGIRADNLPGRAYPCISKYLIQNCRIVRMLGSKGTLYMCPDAAGTCSGCCE